MTNEVQITIQGLQPGSEEEPIILKVQGNYHFINGSHFIRYEERLDAEAITQNTIKISPKQVAITKKGAVHSRMVFDTEEVTQTAYPTQYGSIDLDIKTSSILLSEKEDEVELIMVYSLSSGSSPLSEHEITINITACK